MYVEFHSVHAIYKRLDNCFLHVFVFFLQVTERALLDKEAVMQRRAASRAETASPKIDEDDKFK
ncbi:hypothetical protein DPMN_133810 [Dreissena polymorpha]|uniref:Uncharacterized protein n=1 Tax=Dreissena polymorpha TaxID=45954 RepID=A0A9D4JA47_DREPO|nr:hypothetical protein DPMN_133810 [Dreissena polymorpha]